MRDTRDTEAHGRTSPLRLYGGAIGVASGAYAIYLATGMMDAAMMSAWFMLALGAIVLAHGILLVTPVAAGTGFARASGPLMLVYGTLMILNQAWLAVSPPMTTTGMGMGTRPLMAWDPGMVVLALLMLASGVIMTARRPGAERAGAGA